MKVRLISAQSIALDWLRKRLSRSAFSDACIFTVKPRSLLACSAIAGMAVTGGPACCRTMSLMFCAQMVGNPVTAPDPTAAPAVPSRARRLSRALVGADLRVILGSCRLRAGPPAFQAWCDFMRKMLRCTITLWRLYKQYLLTKYEIYAYACHMGDRIGKSRSNLSPLPEIDRTLNSPNRPDRGNAPRKHHP